MTCCVACPRARFVASGMARRTPDERERNARRTGPRPNVHGFREKQPPAHRQRGEEAVGAATERATRTTNHCHWACNATRLTVSPGNRKTRQHGTETWILGHLRVWLTILSWRN
jgi:hypothetical protein